MTTYDAYNLVGAIFKSKYTLLTYKLRRSYGAPN